MKLTLSNRYEFMAEFNNWDQAMEKLNEIYKKNN